MGTPELMEDAVGPTPRDTVSRTEWQTRLRKAGLTSCKLPANVVFSGHSDRATIRLRTESVTANMQSDIGAVEAWAAALLVHCDAKQVSVQLPPDAAASGGGHLERLLYRLHRFGELLPVRIEGVAPQAKALMPSKLLLNVPSDDRAVTEEVERLKTAAGTASLDLAGSEHALEVAMVGSQALRTAFARGAPGGMSIMRQCPVGLFRNAVKRGSEYSIFTGGRSAIDLLAIDDTTLLLFELKNAKNKKAGAISEAFFYACVMRDVLRKTFQFDELKVGRSLPPITPDEISKCTEIRSVILAPDMNGPCVHPLIYRTGLVGSSVISGINEAAARTWIDKPVRFEAWTFKADRDGTDFEFTRIDAAKASR
jgi:hypothetical protein